MAPESIRTLPDWGDLSPKEQVDLERWWIQATASRKNELWAHLEEADRLAREIIGNTREKESECPTTAHNLYFLIFS